MERSLTKKRPDFRLRRTERRSFQAIPTLLPLPLSPSTVPMCSHSPERAPLAVNRRIPITRSRHSLLQTKSFSYTTSTENTTSAPRLFSLERNCTSKCEPGCIIIGERTKLYACTECCESNLCNTGNGATAFHFHPSWSELLPCLLVPLLLH